MNTEYKKQLGTVGRNALEGKLVDALSMLGRISRELGSWEVGSAVEKLQDNYEAMLRFVAEGADDPGRNDLVDTVTAETLALTMRLSRELSMELGTELYYSTARTILGRRDESLSKNVRSYREELARLDNDFDSITDPHRTTKAEQMLRDIFNRIWVTHPLSTDDFAAVEEMLQPSVPRHARLLVVSAVGLGHTSYYDTKRLAWLLAKYVEYAESDPELALRALVEAMCGMIRYRRRPLAKAVKDVLASARELPQWDKDFASVAIEFMRAVDTKGISAKLQDDFISSMGEMDKELRDRIRRGEIDLESFASEINPEWAEDINHSKLGQNMREMAEIQAEGGDVFMLSFSQMKRFPFFHDLANWYLPFYESHSAVVSGDSDDGVISALLTKMPILCDSDKYSLVLSLNGIPESQRHQLAKALRMQAEQMADSLSEIDKASGDSKRRNYINKYIQNIYRTTYLFRGNKDLFDFFNEKNMSPDLLSIKPLKGNPSSIDLYETVAQFYFKNRHWKEAAAAFSVLDKSEMPDGRRSQQKGYAFEKSGQTDKALMAYEEAEMLSANSEWTRRRLVKTLRLVGDFDRAASYYKSLSDANPDDPKLALATAETFLDAERYELAETAFYKAAYLMPESLSVLRGLAWAQFVNGKADKASENYDKILSIAPERDDFLNAAYVKWAQKDIKQAITLMRMASQDDPKQIDLIGSEIIDKEDILIKAGVDISLRQNLLEAIRLSSKA